MSQWLVTLLKGAYVNKLVSAWIIFDLELKIIINIIQHKTVQTTTNKNKNIIIIYIDSKKRGWEWYGLQYEWTSWLLVSLEEEMKPPTAPVETIKNQISMSWFENTKPSYIYIYLFDTLSIYYDYILNHWRLPVE